MTERGESYDEIAKQVAEEWANRDFWVGKCRVCALGIELVMRELGVGRTEALTLWAAMMTENAGNNFRIAIHRWEALQGKMLPIAEKLANAAEEESRRPPWYTEP